MTPEQNEWYDAQYEIAQYQAKPFYIVDWDHDRWPNFKPNEIACRGTGLLYIDPDAMDRLQAFRERLGKPFSPNSAFRFQSHNDAIGGAARSMHMLGIAFDIPMIAPIEKMIRIAEEVGFNAIGVYPWGVHVDARPWRARW